MLCVLPVFKLEVTKDTIVCFTVWYFSLLTSPLDSLQKIGGGFCDCGDPNSWKASAFCANHKPIAGSVSLYESSWWVESAGGEF